MFPAMAQPEAPTVDYLEAFPYQTTPDAVAYPFIFSSPDSAYLTRFREMFGLASVIAPESTDLGRARALCRWVYFRLEHDGRQTFGSTDAFDILQAAQAGESVQCVEYGLVLATAFNAVGIPARPLYLKAANVQTKASAAGHALAEAWLPDQGKWVMVDAQADIIPMLGSIPLNALELQQALLARRPELTALSSTKSPPRSYFRWVKQYLYYFDTTPDNRYGIRKSLTGLMLVPVGARKPTIFQRTTRIRNMRYTHSATTFYAPPSGARPQIAQAEADPALLTY